MSQCPDLGWAARCRCLWHWSAVPPKGHWVIWLWCTTMTHWVFFCSATVKRNNISIHYWVMLTFDYQTLIQQSIPAEPSHPLPSQDTAGHLSAFSVPGVVHLQIFHCLGAEHLPTRGLFPSLWHARSFLSEYNYTEDITEKSRLAHVKDRWLLRHVLDFMHAFLHCLSSQNYLPKLASYQCESTLFG